ncbi:transporter substrate-binding domain-containing protein [Streptomyces sp. NPDC005840]|uniref:transporter substrate-binding domain-containing protein n=1 Tax=Streptomyces sp. NPDC005840 TaxID=3157072 RepID=UPI0033DABE22
MGNGRLTHRGGTALTMVLASLVGLVSCSHSSGARTSLTVGFKSNQPGLSALYGDDTRSKGFDSSLALQVFKTDLGYDFGSKLVNRVEWQRMLTNKDVDAVFASISVTDDLRKKFIFAGPYLKASLGALTLRKRKRIPVSKLSSLTGLKVCYVKNSTSEKTIEYDMKSDTSIKSIPADTQQRCLENLRTKNADVYISDVPILAGLYNSTKQNKMEFHLDDTTTLANAESQTYGIALRSDEKNLCIKLDKALDKELQNSSTKWNDFFTENLNGGQQDTSKIDAAKPTETNKEWCNPHSSQG